MHTTIKQSCAISNQTFARLLLSLWICVFSGIAGAQVLKPGQTRNLRFEVLPLHLEELLDNDTLHVEIVDTSVAYIEGTSGEPRKTATVKIFPGSGSVPLLILA